MRIIILAAGQGKRLLPHTQDRPKVMVAPDGRTPLIGNAVAALATDPRVDDIVVVGGYRYDVLDAYLASLDHPQVSGVRNAEFDRHGPQLSILLGLESYRAGGICIMNGDTFFDRHAIGSMLDRLSGSSNQMTLFGSRADRFEPDDMKIAIGAAGSVLAVGKSLDAADCSARSCGVLGCRGEAEVFALAAALRAGLEAGEATWHGALNRRIADGAAVTFGRIDPES